MHTILKRHSCRAKDSKGDAGRGFSRFQSEQPRASRSLISLKHWYRTIDSKGHQIASVSRENVAWFSLKDDVAHTLDVTSFVITHPTVEPLANRFQRYNSLRRISQAFKLADLLPWIRALFLAVAITIWPCNTLKGLLLGSDTEICKGDEEEMKRTHARRLWTKEAIARYEFNDSGYDCFRKD